MMSDIRNYFKRRKVDTNISDKSSDPLPSPTNVSLPIQLETDQEDSQSYCSQSVSNQSDETISVNLKSSSTSPVNDGSDIDDNDDTFGSINNDDFEYDSDNCYEFDLENHSEFDNISLDIGVHLCSKVLASKQSNSLSDQIRFQLLENVIRPDKNYNFNADTSKQRKFQHDWFARHGSWLCYSPSKKGALCLYCVLFPPILARGSPGAFASDICVDYAHFHAVANRHINNDYHKEAEEKAKSFLNTYRHPETSVIGRINRSYAGKIERNRNILKSILSGILFCAVNELPLRGSSSTLGNVRKLLDFRIESGDKVLKNHLEKGPKNASYLSHQVQNDLLTAAEIVLRRELVELVNKSNGFSILADETCDISGHEQLSIGVRFLDQTGKIFFIYKLFTFI